MKLVNLCKQWLFRSSREELIIKLYDKILKIYASTFSEPL
jgi:hypothetical protein